MKVIFADVGQGTCQIILTGQQKAIVIDTGSSPTIVQRLLYLFSIQKIELLCISHCHLDHSGGASAANGLLVSYEKAIDRIALTVDSGTLKSDFLRLIHSQLKNGSLRSEQVEVIDVKEKPRPLWSRRETDTILTAIAPLGGHTLSALADNNPNASSAVFELRHKGSRIVFSGDSEYAQWRDLLRLRNGTPFQCRVVTVPHHGGLMSGTSDDLEWLTTAAIKSDIVVVSVGTSNQHQHPRQEVIEAFSRQGAHVLCTQITRRCCSDLESCRPGVIGGFSYPAAASSKPDRVRKKSSSGSRNVACAGTIAASLSEDGIEMERLPDHKMGVDRLVSAGHSPACRVPPKP